MRFVAKLSSFSALLGICLLLFGCQKITKTYSVVPAIAFKSYTVSYSDSTGVPDYKLTLIITFTDGDGDIGLNQDDTIGNFNKNSVYYYNLWVPYYEKIPGPDSFKQVNTQYPYNWGDTANPSKVVNYNGRIPDVTPQGKDKAINGTIQYDFDLGSGTKSGTKAIRFGFILVDRALHKSNMVYSPEIDLY